MGAVGVDPALQRRRAWTSPCKDGRIVGVRGRAEDRVNHGRLGPKDLFGWQANDSAGPADPAAGPARTASWSRPTGTPRWTRVVGRTRAAAGRAGPERDRLLHHRPAVPRGVLHARPRSRTAASAPTTSTATPGCARRPPAEALKESFGCDGQPGSYTDIDHADVIALFGHNMAETQTVLWMRDPRPAGGRRTRRGWSASTRGRPRSPGAPTVHLAPRPGTNVALMNALLHEIIAQRLGRPRRTSRRTPSASTSWRSGCADCTAGVGRARSATCRPTQIREAARLLGTRRAAAVDRAAGLLPVPPGDRRRRAGQQHAPAPRHARPAGLRRPADERPAHRARTPASAAPTATCPASATGPTTTHVADLARIWNVDPIADPALRAADARDADLPLRRAGLDPLPVDQRHQPGRVAAGAGPDPRRSSAQERLFVVVQDIFLTETAQLADVVLPAATWGEKTGTFTNADRTVHLSEKAVDPPGEARPDLDIFLDYARRHGLPRQGRRPAGRRGTTRRRPSRRWKRVQRAAGPATTPASPTRSCAAAAASSGRATTSTRTAPSGSTPTATFWAAPGRTARATAGTWSPARRWSAAEYRALNPDGRAVLKAAEYLPPHELPERGVPVPADHRPHALPLPHPHQDRPRARSCRPPRPRCGWRCRPRDAAAHGLRRGRPGRGHAPRAARCGRRLRVSGIRPGVALPAVPLRLLGHPARLRRPSDAPGGRRTS